MPEGIDITLVPAQGRGRLQRYRNFTRFVEREMAGSTRTCVVGFNKMPLLDVYFAADSCFLEKAETQRGSYYRFTPRFRHFRDYELAVFGADSQTRVLVLSALQRRAYEEYYPGCASRLSQLPPGIARDRRLEHRDPSVRAELRQELGLGVDDLLILQVGSGFRIKGVDRSLRAIAALPAELKKRCRYVLIGQDRASPFHRQARRLGIEGRVSIMAGRSDVLRFFLAADLLLHPADAESAGYVLLEAAIAGLPVLTTATCGYAVHIEQAGAGEVCAEPFSQNELDSRLADMLTRLSVADWSARGIDYGKCEELYSMPEVAMNEIEKAVGTREALS